MESKGLKYEINIFDLKDLDELGERFKQLEKALESEDFMIFLAEKCMKELNQIIDKELRTEEYETEYRENNNYETTKEQIRIFNDSMVDLSNLSEETLLNYKGITLPRRTNISVAALETYVQ